MELFSKLGRTGKSIYYSIYLKIYWHVSQCQFSDILVNSILSCHGTMQSFYEDWGTLRLDSDGSSLVMFGILSFLSN